jgi:uncharacterized protein YheU (UPF0270 family)
VYRSDMPDEREVAMELEREGGGDEVALVRVQPADLEPETLRTVIESFVLREGTDYGIHETSLGTKVAQVLLQLGHGEAHVTLDPARNRSMSWSHRRYAMHAATAEALDDSMISEIRRTLRECQNLESGTVCGETDLIRHGGNDGMADRR